MNDSAEIARLKKALMECYEVCLANAHEYTDEWCDRHGYKRMNGTTGWPSVICGDVGAVVAEALNMVEGDEEREWNAMKLRAIRRRIATMKTRERVPE